VNHRDRGNRESRQVDGEYTSFMRETARIDPAIVRLSARSAEGETKTHAGAIGATLLERAEELVRVPAWETAAFVLDLDEHALGAGGDPERNGATRLGELECVLQEISDDGSEDLAIGLDGHSVVDGQDRQGDAPCVCLQGCGRREFFDESGNKELLSILNALPETDLRERATNERA
jgi:hypothetical protein